MKKYSMKSNGEVVTDEIEGDWVKYKEVKELEDFVKEVEDAKGFSGFIKMQRKAQKLQGKKVK